MRLADFIENNTEAILSEWVAFAESCGPAGGQMDLEGLRDHAVEMLGNIVIDLRTPQTGAEQAHKSKGGADSGAQDDEGAQSAGRLTAGGGIGGGGVAHGATVSPLDIQEA